MSEKAILAVLDHPFIVQLGGAFQGTMLCMRMCMHCTGPQSLVCLYPFALAATCRCLLGLLGLRADSCLRWFADRKYLYMLLEYVVGGEFFTHLRKVGRFDNNTAKFYAAQVAMIFDYLHRQVRTACACPWSYCSARMHFSSVFYVTGYYLP
jgi:serine/threonine protein kinase